MDETEARALMARQAEVHDDLERLEAYGAEVPEVWLQARYDGADLVALLTEPDAHRDRLIALVEHPDRLMIRAAPFSRRALRRIGREALAMVHEHGGHWTAAGPAVDGSGITLRADQEALALLLHEHFGEALQITLGMHRFLFTTTPSTAPAPAPTSTIDLPDAELTVELDRPTSVPGHTVRGRVRIRNTSTTRRLRLDVGAPAIGLTLHPDGTPAGGFTGAIAGLERRIDLAPGESDTVGFVAGSDAVAPARGAALPPGRFLLVVRLRVFIDDRAEVIVTPPVELVVER